MSEHSKGLLRDGFRSVGGGMDGGRPPTEIGPDQNAYLTNATCRGGFLKPRPGYIPRPLTFGEDEDLQEAFEEGLFQCAHPYVSDSGRASIVAAISGKLYKIDIQQTFAVSDISIAGDLNPSNRTVGWMVQAENYLIFQDNQTIPLIFNGASSRRATNSEIRPGAVMAVSNGRIWYALENGTSFRATDIVRGPSGTAANRYRDAILKETENTFLNEGGDFSVPGGQGRIRAMVVPANLDTSLGQGPLQVFTTEGIFSVNAPIDRNTWKDVTYPIQTESLIDFGAMGPRSAITHNGDIFYRSPDGFRSFVLARREFSTWGNTAISREIQNVLDGDQQLLLQWGSAVQFDNRILMTTWGRNSDRGVIHSALGVLNFDLISAMRQKSPPAWEGIWTGLNILQVLTVKVDSVDRCFAFVVNQENKICLWEISRKNLFDNVNRRITWGLTSRAFTCSSDMSLKRLERADVFVDQLVGVADFSMAYRPDGAICWQDWHQWSECATFEQCSTPTPGVCQTIKNFQSQYRPKMRLPQPETICNLQTNQPFHDFFEVQLKLTITGSVRIRKLTVTARDRAEDATGSCPPVAACKEVECCNDNPNTYTSEEIVETPDYPYPYPYPNPFPYCVPGVMLFSDFQGENGGASATNYDAFEDWEVVGLMDLVTDPLVGIVTGFVIPGVMVDLLGTAIGINISDTATLQTKEERPFVAGCTYRIQIYLAGNQRSVESDHNDIEVVIGTMLNESFQIAYNAVIGLYEFTFVPTTSESAKIAITCTVSNVIYRDLGALLASVKMESL